MQDHFSTIDLNKTYQLHPKDFNYLQFRANRILGKPELSNIDMTTNWNILYQKRDFRHYLHKRFEEFQDKIQSLKNQIRKLNQNKASYQKYLQFQDYFQIFSRLDNEKDPFQKVHRKNKIFSRTNQQKEKFLNDLDQKCRIILYKMDAMKIPLAAQVSQELQNLETKDNKIKVYETILKQIHLPQHERKKIHMLDYSSLIDKEVKQSLAKFQQIKTTDWQKACKLQEQINKHLKFGMSELVKYFKGQINLQSVLEVWKKKGKEIQNDNYQKVVEANKIFIDLLKEISDQANKGNDKSNDKNIPNWENLLNSTLKYFKDALKTKLSCNSLRQLNKKIKSYSHLSQSATKLQNRLDQYCNELDTVNMVNHQISMINGKSFNLEDLKTIIEMLKGAKIDEDEKIDLQGQLEKEVVYGLLISLNKEIQLNEKNSFLQIVMNNKNLSKIHQFKGVKKLYECFILKKDQLQALENSKKMVKRLLKEQFKYTFEDSKYFLFKDGHISYFNLLECIEKLSDRMKNRHRKIQIDNVQDVFAWINQTIAGLDKMLKKNPGSINVFGVAHLQMNEQKYNQFIQKFEQEYREIKNRFVFPQKSQSANNEHQQMKEKVKFTSNQVKNAHLTSQNLLIGPKNDTQTTFVPQMSQNLEKGIKFNPSDKLIQLTEQNIQLQNDKLKMSSQMTDILMKIRDLQKRHDQLTDHHKLIKEQNLFMRLKLNDYQVDVDELIFNQKLKQKRAESLIQTLAKYGAQNTKKAQIFESKHQFHRSQLQSFLWVMQQMLVSKQNKKNQLQVNSCQSKKQLNENKKINTTYELDSLYDYSWTTLTQLSGQQVYNSFQRQNLNILLGSFFDQQKLSQIIPIIDCFHPVAQKTMYIFGKLINVCSNEEEKQPHILKNTTRKQSEESDGFQRLEQKILEEDTTTPKMELFAQTPPILPKLTSKNQYSQTIDFKVICQECALYVQMLQQHKVSYQKQINDQKEFYQQQKTDSKDQFDNSIKKLKANFQIQKTKLIEEQTKILQLKNKEIQDIQNQHQQALRKIQKTHEQEIIQKEQKNKQLLIKIAQFQSEKSKEPQKVIQQVDNSFDGRQKRLREVEKERDQMKKNQREFKKQLKQTQDKYLKEIKELKLTHAKELKQKNSLINDYKYEVETMKKDLLSAKNNNSEGMQLAQNSQQSERQKLQINKAKRQLEKQRKNTQELYDQLQQSTKKHKTAVKEYQYRLSENEEKIYKLNMEVTALKQCLSQQKNERKQTPSFESSLLIFDRFFMGQILDESYEQKYQLYNLIQQKTRKTIKKTRLLYRFDKQNSTSFHNYIDGIENLVIMVQTRKNIFGAFSTAKIQPKYKEPQSTTAFIFSYHLEGQISCYNYSNKHEKAKSLTYDEYFLIVGNSEIRLKSGQSLVYSNFGITNCYYDPNQLNVEVLLKRGDEREDQLVTYECFEVVFQEDRF